DPYIGCRREWMRSRTPGYEQASPLVDAHRDSRSSNRGLCVGLGFHHGSHLAAPCIRKKGAAQASAATSIRFCIAGPRASAELPSGCSLPDTKYMPDTSASV